MFNRTKHASNSAIFPIVNQGWGCQAPGQGPGATPRIHNLLKAASSRYVVNKQDIRFRAMEKHEHNLLSYSPRWTGLHYLRPPMNKYLFTSKGNGVGRHKHHVVTKRKSDPTMVRHLIGTIELGSFCFKKITPVKLCISNSLWTTYITENSSYHKFLDTVGPVQRVQQWHTYPTWPSTIETPHKDLKTINKV